jgi:hypothetical protein
MSIPEGSRAVRSERRGRKGESFRVTRANARIMAISHSHCSSRALVRRSSGGLRKTRREEDERQGNPNISILMKLHYFASSGGCVGVFNSESSSIPFPLSPFLPRQNRRLIPLDELFSFATTPALLTALFRSQDGNLKTSL